MKSGVFSFCKGIDTFCPLGPWIVTADEIPDAHNLAMQLRVNGEPRQNSHSSKMSVKISEILSHYSPMGYSAGDVVSTGTVSGVAAFSGDPKAWYLKPGDVVECEIEKIGILRNPVISWEQAYGKKPAALATQESLRYVLDYAAFSQSSHLGQQTQCPPRNPLRLSPIHSSFLRYDSSRRRADRRCRLVSSSEARNCSSTRCSRRKSH